MTLSPGWRCCVHAEVAVAMFHVRIDLLKGAFVQQAGEAFARGAFALGVLRLDAGRAAALIDLLAVLIQFVEKIVVSGHGNVSRKDAKPQIARMNTDFTMRTRLFPTASDTDFTDYAQMNMIGCSIYALISNGSPDASPLRARIKSALASGGDTFRRFTRQ